MKHLLLLDPNSLNDNEVSELLTHLNDQYRIGEPLVSNDIFDSVYLPLLAARLPEHPLVTHVQPEPLTDHTIKHKSPMLSTDKAYTKEDVKAYIDLCQKSAFEANISEPLLFRVLAKLDGQAVSSIDTAKAFATRGDGNIGNDITAFISKGVKIIGDFTGDAVGELVIQQSYFEKELSGKFKHPRNFVVGISGADNISEAGVKALDDGAVNLVLFNSLPASIVSAYELIERLDELCDAAKASVDYLTDGTIIEVCNIELREYMGHNGEFHLWQLAKKSVGETAKVPVIGIEWQTGRDKITPVLVLEPTLLSGAMISKVTAHNAGNVKSLGLGSGAVIELVRSGEVIPKILSVISSVCAEIPDFCPCCKMPVKWENDIFITCVNDSCKARLASSLEYHFKLIGADLFGGKTTEKLVEAGLTTIDLVHAATESDFIKAGFGGKQASNLCAELVRIKSTPVDDHLILASLGIHKCGRGTSKRILKTLTLAEIDGATHKHLLSLSGFAEITAQGISSGITEKMDLISFLRNWLTVKQTKKSAGATGAVLTLSGLNIVFTGKMTQSRGEMTEHAEIRGANVQSSVGKTTSFLVIGESVGATKIAAAEKKNVKVITLDEYFAKAG